MAKRGGKAATRRQRQRAANRPAQRPAAPPASPTSSSAADVPSAVEEVVRPTAAATPAPTAPAAPARPTTPARRRGAAIAGELYGSSRLSEKAAAEYHYVVADLHNILVLSGVLIGLLAVAFVLVNVLGIGKIV